MVSRKRFCLHMLQRAHILKRRDTSDLTGLRFSLCLCLCVYLSLLAKQKSSSHFASMLKIERPSVGKLESQWNILGWFCEVCFHSKTDFWNSNRNFQLKVPTASDSSRVRTIKFKRAGWRPWIEVRTQPGRGRTWKTRPAKPCSMREATWQTKRSLRVILRGEVQLSDFTVAVNKTQKHQ